MKAFVAILFVACATALPMDIFTNPLLKNLKEMRFNVENTDKIQTPLMWNPVEERLLLNNYNLLSLQQLIRHPLFQIYYNLPLFRQHFTHPLFQLYLTTPYFQKYWMVPTFQTFFTNPTLFYKYVFPIVFTEETQTLPLSYKNIDELPLYFNYEKMNRSPLATYDTLIRPFVMNNKNIWENMNTKNIWENMYNKNIWENMYNKNIWENMNNADQYKYVMEKFITKPEDVTEVKTDIKILSGEEKKNTPIIEEIKYNIPEMKVLDENEKITRIPLQINEMKDSFLKKYILDKYIYGNMKIDETTLPIEKTFFNTHRFDKIKAMSDNMLKTAEIEKYLKMGGDEMMMGENTGAIRNRRHTFYQTPTYPITQQQVYTIPTTYGIYGTNYAYPTLTQPQQQQIQQIYV